MLKKENGITLIALSVTIIVLLILSGIAVGTAASKKRKYSRIKRCKGYCRERIFNGKDWSRFTYRASKKRKEFN